ncbi:MAG: hypothetical protein MUO82_10255 [Candidatus Thermoplasmatota archaeon]|nr:hypothetical protein [Candidatus Thermoplasmatota archaeon]
MRKIAIFLISLMVIVIGFLCGCNDKIPEKREYNIGESLIFENIRYTFLSAYWNDTTYTLKIKAENIDNKNRESSNVMITRYKMQNGYTYDPVRMYGVTFITFDLNLFGNDTKVLTDFSSIDRDFLPVSKIYLQLYSPGGQWIYSKNTKPIEINVI